MNTTELDRYTQELIEQSVKRGKFNAYTAVLELLKAEGLKSAITPTTSADTLDNLWTAVALLVEMEG